MRWLLVLYAVFALILITSACEDPHAIPRTVPPGTAPDASRETPAARPEVPPLDGVGAIIET
jgi:hypothetical protein